MISSSLTPLLLLFSSPTGLFKKRAPSSYSASGNASRSSSNDAFRNRFANDESLDVEDDGVPRDGRRPPLYEHQPPEPPRRQTTTVSIEDEREILEAAARAGIRINGRVPEVGDFFTGEPVPTRTRRHRRWIRKRRENEKEALRRREEAEGEVVAGAAARAYGGGGGGGGGGGEEERRFEEETRRAMEESRRAWDAATTAAANSTSSYAGRARETNAENDEEEEKLMKIASEISKAAVNGEKLNSIQRLISDLDINSRLNAANVNEMGAAALGRTLGRKFAARFHLTRCLSEFDVLDETADGFYDLWRDESNSTSLLFGGEDAPLPDLEDLLSLRKKGASAESIPNEEHAIAYVVDRKSDDILNSLDELAKKIREEDPLDVFARAKALAMLVSNRLGGACETETKAFSIRATAMRDEMKLKKINASCVVHIGHLSFGAEKQRAILFKALASCADVPCRLLRGGVYCDGDEDCAKIFVVKNSGSSDNGGTSRQPPSENDDAFFASLGNDLDVRQIDLLRNVGKLTSPSGGKKPLSSVEREFFEASSAPENINFDFFSHPSSSNEGDDSRKKKVPPPSSNFNRSYENDLFNEMSSPSSSSASLLDLSEVKMKTSTAAPAGKPTLTPKEEAAEKKRILIRRQAERILEVQEAEEEKEQVREIELKFRHKFHKKWDKVVKNLSLGETLEVFGVEVKDKKSTNELRKAYRKAMLKFHPDRFARGSSLQDRVNGEEIFKIINAKMENS